jgi:hypothetical protein
MWNVDSCMVGSSAEGAPKVFSRAVPTNPVSDFVHDLNNQLLVIRGHTALALTALDDGDVSIEGNAAAELRSLLEVVDEVSTASRALRRTLTAPAA